MKRLEESRLTHGIERKKEEEIDSYALRCRKCNLFRVWQ